MKAYVITTIDSKRLIDGEIRDYPDCLPECEVFYGPSPDDTNQPPSWFRIRRPTELARRHAWCCYLSKIRCLEEHIKRYPNEDCIMLEDDVTFCDHFDEIYDGFMRKVPSDWAILWFEYRTKSLAIEVAPAILTVPVCWLASMLVFRAEYIKDIVNDLKKPHNYRDCEVDQVLSRLSSKYPSYLPLFSVCGQRGGYSYIQRKDRSERGFTTQVYKSLDGTIKRSSHDDYKVYLQ